MAIPPPEQPSLTVLSGPLGGTVFVVDDSIDNVLVGSDPSCRFALPGTDAAPLHARLWIDLEGITVYDTNAPTGVYINDDRVQGQARLRNGDILWLGTPGDEKSVMLQCRLPQAASAEPAASAAPAVPADSSAASAPPISTAAAMMAIDLDPTVSFKPEPAVRVQAPEAPALPEPPTVLAPDAIQPEPTVMLAPGDDEVLAESDRLADSEPTVAMLPDDGIEISEEPIADTMSVPADAPSAASSGAFTGDETASLTTATTEPPAFDETPAVVDDGISFEDPPPTVSTGWDASSGGIPAGADEPWLQAAPPLAVTPPEADPAMAEATMMDATIMEPAAADATIASAPGDATIMDATVAEAPAAAPPPPPAAPVSKTTVAAAGAAGATVAAGAASTAAATAAATAAGAASTGAAAPTSARSARPASSEPKSARPATPAAPSPKPRREPPPAAAAPPSRRREPAPPVAEGQAPPPARKGAPIGLLIGGGLAAAALVAAGGWWMLTRGSEPSQQAPAAPPPTVVDARPAGQPPVTAAPEEVAPAPPVDAPVEEETTIVTAPTPGTTPTPVPSRAPSATPPPTRVAAAPPPVTAAPAGPAPAVVAAGIVNRAETARRAGDLDAAAQLFDEALKADPGNAAATSGKAAVGVARIAARKVFMPGRTVVQTQDAKADMAGFDTADVSVKKAPDFSGRIEFAVSPARVKSGDNYSVQIYLVNEGKKAIKVSGVTLTTNLNGTKSARPGAPRVKEVAPGQRALIEEIPGVWPEEVTWWSTEVLVTANKGDSLKNLLTWK